jgi:hypothetical protein
MVKVMLHSFTRIVEQLRIRSSILSSYKRLFKARFHGRVMQYLTQPSDQQRDLDYFSLLPHFRLHHNIQRVVHLGWESCGLCLSLLHQSSYSYRNIILSSQNLIERLAEAQKTTVVVLSRPLMYRASASTSSLGSDRRVLSF